MVGVDNLQWLDEVSRQAVTFVARRLPGRHIVIVATSPSARDVPEAAGVFREVRLPRLEEASAHRLLERCAPGLDQEHRDWVVGLAAGNPLALTELAAMPLAARRERQRAERHQAIIAAARELAEAEGWDAVTTRRLAERVEYSQPVLYSHFDGRDAIVRAVAIQGLDRRASCRERV